MIQDWHAVIAACRQVPTLWNRSPALVLTRPPASAAAIAAAEAQIGPFPAEHRALLAVTDGLHLYPWDSDGSGGIMLCGVSDTIRWTEYTYDVEGDPGPDRPFDVVGWTVGEGCYIATTRNGAAHVLEPMHGSDLWLRGEGAIRLAPNLRALALELAAPPRALVVASWGRDVNDRGTRDAVPRSGHIMGFAGALILTTA